MVSPSGYLLTSRHPFEINAKAVRSAIERGASTLLVHKYDRDTGYRHSYPATLVGFPESDADIALLKIEFDDTEKPRCNIRLRYKDAALFDARMMGYRLDLDVPNASEIGSVHDVADKSDSIKIKLSAYRGYSGGLAINQFGEGFGVLSGKYILPQDFDSWAAIDFEENKVLEFVGLRPLLSLVAHFKIPAASEITSQLEEPGKSVRSDSLKRILEEDPLAAIKITQDLDSKIFAGLHNHENRFNLLIFYQCIRYPDDTKKIFKVFDGYVMQAAAVPPTAKRLRIPLSAEPVPQKQAWLQKTTEQERIEDPVGTRFAIYILNRARDSLKRYEETGNLAELSETLDNFDVFQWVARKTKSKETNAELASGFIEYGLALTQASEKGLIRDDAPGLNRLLARAHSFSPEDTTRFSLLSSAIEMSSKEREMQLEMLLAQAEPQSERTAIYGREYLVAKLLAHAEQQITSLKLTRPAGDNAYETLQAVLAIDADNQEAKGALRTIAARYAALARARQGAGNPRAAIVMVERGIEVDPQHGELLALREELTKPEHPGETPDAKVASLLAKAEQQLAAGRITKPAGDNAYKTLNAALKLQPGNREALKQLASIPKSCAMVAHSRQQKGDTGEALSTVEECLRFFPQDSALIALRNELSREANSPAEVSPYPGE